MGSWASAAAAAAAMFLFSGCSALAGGALTVPGVVGGASLHAEFRLAPCPAEIDARSVASVGTGTGAHVGTIVLPGPAAVPLGGADLVVEDPGGRTLAMLRTDGCGRFRLEALGPAELRVRYRVRSLAGALPLRPGDPATLIADTSALRVAVVEGEYDHVERILDQLGIRYALLSPERLQTQDLGHFDVLFINCANPLRPEDTAPKLRAFVEGGGALYVSDRALPYVEKTWPDVLVPFGKTTWPIEPARIVEADLQAYLHGADVVPLIHDLPNWKKLERTSATVRPLLSNRDSGEPHMVLFPSGRGVVGFTTFHHQAQLNDAMLYSLFFLVTRL